MADRPAAHGGPDPGQAPDGPEWPAPMVPEARPFPPLRAAAVDGPQPPPLQGPKQPVRRPRRADNPPMAQPLFDGLHFGAVTMDVLAAAGDTPAGIVQRQWRRLAALLAHAKAHSPLFARTLAGTDTARVALSDLPVTHRAELMAAFDDWVTEPALTLDGLRRFTADTGRIAEPYLDHWQVWESSGTSGLAGIFVQDARALAVYDALESLRRASPQPWRRWMDPLLTTERLAFVGATGGHFASLVHLLRLAALQPWRVLPPRMLSILQPTAALVAGLNDCQPSIVATYPTAAALLADEAAAGRLRIAPREVWTGGETLSAAVRAHVERHLGGALRNSYGASEFLPLGWECRCGRLHANADWAILEPVDAQYRPVPPGERSHSVLLTNLANRVQPIVRYDLGDSITVAAEPCPCGSPLPVIDVRGRCDDVLRMAGAHGAGVTLLPLALAEVLEQEAGLFDFELRQVDAHTLCLRVSAEAASAHALARGCTALQAFLHRQGVRSARVTSEVGEAATRGRSGKARRVIAGP